MVGEIFKERISRASGTNDSRLILALDVAEDDLQSRGLEKRYMKVLNEVSGSLAAVKIGYPLVLSTGIDIFSKAKSAVDVPLIADFKIADVPHINQQIARCAFQAGADGVIAQAFVGSDSLEAVAQVAEDENGGLIALPSMSHEGSEEFLQPYFDQLLEVASEAGATGVIGPATRPEDVAALREKLGGEMLILTPGIGAQGAQPGDAIRNGADYEIVGRVIYTSDSPGEKAEELRSEINKKEG